MATTVAQNSILMDLVPLVAQHKWGASVHDSPIPTLTVGGAHPTYMSVLKRILHPGYDDGVATVNSQFAIPNSTTVWPSGFGPPLPFGFLRIFDKGLFGPLGGRTLFNLGFANVSSTALNNPIRAIGFYKDQFSDKFFNPGSLFAAPPLAASGPIPWTSPSGMRQPVEWEYELNRMVNPATDIAVGYNPLRRSPKHYSYLFSSSDHSSGTTTPGSVNYVNSPFFWQAGGEKNWEETRVLTDPAVYLPYAMPYATDNGPLLDSTVRVPEERVRGLRIRYRVIRRWRLTWKEAWIWKRTYYLLPDSENRVQFEYVYESVLRN
jgi:hypothetical protein